MHPTVKPGIRILVSIAACAAASCGGGHPGGSPDGGGSSGQYWSNGNGTFTGTNPSGAAVSATFTDAQVFFEEVSTGASGTSYAFDVVTSSGSGGTGGLLTFSSPTGASGSFVSDIAITGAPAVGTVTSTSSVSSGGLQLIYSTPSDTQGYFAHGPQQQVGAEGSWSIDLTSATVFGGSSDGSGSAAYYTVHGTLTAQMIDENGGSGTLNLTF